MRNLIGFAGPPGSGKTTLTKVVAARLGIPSYAFGDFIRDQADGSDLQTFGQNYVTERGASGFVDDFLEFYEITDESACIVEGIRHFEVWRELVARSRSALLVFRVAPLPILDRRLRERDQDLATRLAHPVEKEITMVQSLADIVLDEQSVDFAADLVLERVNTEFGLKPK